jgi:hypothetical protein
VAVGVGDLRPGHGLVTVRADPHAVVALWLPGLNQKLCATEITHRGATVAVRLAADIRRAPVFPSGTFNCANDDGSAVELIFSYDGPPAEQVLVGLSGCSRITAPHRAAREVTPQLMRDLSGLAPARWTKYFAG